MKKFKKISAMLMASVVTVGAVSSLSAGARSYIESYDDIENMLDGSFAVSRSDEGGNLFADGSACKWGYDDVSKYHDTTFILANNMPDSHTPYFERIQLPPIYSNSIFFRLADKSSYDAAGIILKENFPELVVEDSHIPEPSCSDDFYYFLRGYNDKLPFEEAVTMNINLEKSRKIYNVLNEQIELTNFEYRPLSFDARPHYGSITEYPMVNEEIRDALTDYVSKNLPDCHIEEEYFDYTDMGLNIPNELNITVVPNEDISPEEHYNIANKIYKYTGIGPYANCYEDTTYSTGDDVIDLHNNIDGDANDDGELMLCDAILIMQAVGNPDQYTLTPQGAYNADIAGNYDGITNMDALAVQKKLLNLE